MAGTFTSLHYHLVFSTKNREPIIHAEIQERLYEYMGGVIRSELNSDAADSLLRNPKNGGLIAIGGVADHVHMIVRWPANRSVSDLMRIVKSKSSGWLNETVFGPKKWGRFSWQEGYGAFSVSKSDLLKVGAYIAKQASHHAKVDFKTEFRRFLEVHEIEFNEDTIWL